MQERNFKCFVASCFCLHSFILVAVLFVPLLVFFVLLRGVTSLKSCFRRTYQHFANRGTYITTVCVCRLHLGNTSDKAHVTVKCAVHSVSKSTLCDISRYCGRCS
jgi:hypothetical protein